MAMQLLLLSRFSHVRLCNPIDGSPTGSPVPGILQARTLEWVAISFSNVWKWKVKIESEVAQSCPTLGNPMDCSLPGSSIHGIFQARVLERGVDVLSYLNCLSYAKKFTVDPIMFCVFFFGCCLFWCTYEIGYQISSLLLYILVVDGKA